jgi:6-phosphogluconolactonase/glucosamine-6-phosphate isomerase/deaminase
MLVETRENPYIKEKLTPLDGATECLNALLEGFKENNTNVLLLLSGGSSLEILNGLDADLIGPKVTICPLDERYSTNPEENNMAQVERTEFFRKARENGAMAIDTRVMEGESQEALAARFNGALVEWFEDNPAGKVIATVGIGPDGHISGIMPYPEEAEKFKVMFDDGNSDHLVEAYDAGDKNPYPLRVTTTMNLIKKIDAAVCYVIGENKKEAVQKVLAQEGSIEVTPARILREIPGKVFLFTDQA